MAAHFDSADLGALLDALRTQPRGEGADAELARETRRTRGVYFTPPALVDFVARRVTSAVLADGASRPLRILDPAAGDGRFLVAVAAELFRRDPSGPSVDERLAASVALERDPRLAALIRERHPSLEVRCCEALLGAGDLGEFDIVVGNPPYVRSIRLGESDPKLREALRGRFHATSHGEWDLYAAFIEKSLGWLAPRGHAGLVVPSRWMTARSACRLRAELAKRQAVSGVLDFGAEQIFTAATTYASTIFLSQQGEPEPVVARLRGDGFEIGAVRASSLCGAPWALSVGRGREIVDAMKRAGEPLGSLARIVKGTGTNADAVFVSDGELDVEDALLHTVVRGRDVTAFGDPDRRIRCVVPYRGDGSLIEPASLRADYPRAAAYFERHRARLESRERGRFRGDRFYCFGRPQNLAALLAREAKIIVPDVAREGRAMLDRGGALVLDSAYAVIPHHDRDLDRILAALNSPAVGLWLRETGVPLRGGYVRMKTAYLESLPIASAPSGDLRAAYGVAAADW